MLKKTNQESLQRTIDSGLENLSTDEIRAMIDRETAKAPDEIDMDYIDLCFALLTAKENGQGSKKIRLKKPVKILLAAAIAAALLVSVITVSGALHLNIPESVAKLENGNAEVDTALENADTTADSYQLTDTSLAGQLAEMGISPVTFPEVITKNDCAIISVENITNTANISTDALVQFTYQDIPGTLLIEQFRSDSSFRGEQHIIVNILSGKTVKANGMDILVFEREDDCVLEYKDRNTLYTLYLDGDLNAAVKFAKSIR